MDIGIRRSVCVYRIGCLESERGKKKGVVEGGEVISVSKGRKVEGR
jgi:hypothetical protein